MCFANVEDVKDLLGITGTKEDAKIAFAVNAANAEVLGYLCLDQCDPKEYVLTADVFRDVRCIDSVSTCIRPIVSVVSVENGGKLLDPDAYVLRGSWIRLCCSCWCHGCRQARVTIIAGFDDSIPEMASQKTAIVAGTTAYAISIFQGIGGGNLKSEQIGRYSYQRFSANEAPGNGAPWWPPMLTAALAPFWRPENSDTQLMRERT